MSHVTKLKMKVKDLDALAEAAPVLGMELHMNQTKYRVYGSRMAPCLHALTLKGAPQGEYEIGLLGAVAGQPEQGYELHSDNMAYSVLRAVGENCDRLKQEYSVALSTRRVNAKLARQGYRVVGREALAGGRVRLRVRSR